MLIETFVETEEDYDAFLRPAIYESIRAVLKYYNLDNATNIYYNGNAEVAKLVGSNRSDSDTADRYTDGIFRNKVFIIPEINRSQFWNNRRDVVEAPVFAIRGDVDLMIHPAYENKKIDVTVVSRHNSRDDADRTVKRINRLRENQVVDFNFSPINHMVLNASIPEFLEKIHGLIEKNKPTGKDFTTWFYENAYAPFHIISNVKGGQKQLVVPRQYRGIGISFTDPFVAKARKATNTGMFEVSFTYSFYFNDFMGWELKYPLNIYQDEIPADYIVTPSEEHKRDTLVQAGPEISDGRFITHPPTGLLQAPYYLKRPEYDPWDAPDQLWIQPVIQARLAVEDVPEQLLCNVFDIPDFDWNEKSKAFFLKMHEVACLHNQSPYFLQVFENDKAVEGEFLSMSATGDVTLKRPVNMSKTYRIVVCINYAIRDYSEKFWSTIAWDEDAWDIVRNVFFWYDFNEIPKPWIHNVALIRKNIDKGWGSWEKFNIYEMSFDFFAHIAR